MDPSTKEGRNTWGAGFLKGGALSMLGDLIGLTAQGKYMSATEYAAGPLAGDVDRAISAGWGVGTGKKHAGSRVLQLVKENTPGGNVWYTRLLTDRLLADQIQRSIDPDYADIQLLRERAAEKNGQEFYWAPGETAPARAPNLYNAVTGGTRQ
jgi:hypothetical protein